MLLLLTWCGIAAFSVSQYLQLPPYSGSICEISDLSTDNSELAQAFSEESISKIPSWQNGSSNPPLSAAQALKKADVFRDRNLIDESVEPNDFSNWQLISIALHPIDSKAGQWCWCATFCRYVTDPKTFQSLQESRSVYILMDGRIADPFESQSKKSPVSAK